MCVHSCVHLWSAGNIRAEMQLAAISLPHGNVNQLPLLHSLTAADNTGAIVPPNTHKLKFSRSVSHYPIMIPALSV